MELENQSAINPYHKSSPIKPNQPSIAGIKFITPSSSFGPNLECPAFESAQISWISPLSAYLIFLDLALVIGPTEHAMDPWMLVDSHQTFSLNLKFSILVRLNMNYLNPNFQIFVYIFERHSRRWMVFMVPLGPNFPPSWINL